jgi:hypothetical protein
MGGCPELRAGHAAPGHGADGIRRAPVRRMACIKMVRRNAEGQHAVGHFAAVEGVWVAVWVPRATQLG